MEDPPYHPEAKQAFSVRSECLGQWHPTVVQHPCSHGLEQGR